MSAWSLSDELIESVAHRKACQRCLLDSVLHSLLPELQAIRDRVHTFPEERTADECIEAVHKVFGVAS